MGKRGNQRENESILNRIKQKHDISNLCPSAEAELKKKFMALEFLKEKRREVIT